MRRLTIDPRPGWQRRVEEHGLMFHTPAGVPYWDESACYQLRRSEVDTLELAVETLHQMCLDIVEEVVSEGRYGLFLIPPAFEELIARSWREQQHSIYGRFDLAYDGVGPPKMLEYNADTPTALVEAAVAQWHWLKDVDERGDQFNSIHEQLIAAWQALHRVDARPIHFAAVSGNVEDYITTEYLRDTAMQAGFETHYLDVEQIGWDAPWRLFVDMKQRPIQQLFKLYPWEWLIREEFGQHIPHVQMRWLEPPWKMLLSNKALLPLLWERFPDCPYLLESSFSPLTGSFVRKPVLAREGANIEVVIDGKSTLTTDGRYSGPFVYQRLGPLKPQDGRYPVFGGWVVNGVACGVGIREDDQIVTQNTSRFVPHGMID
jgi:glutathionylspermidine synthase